MFDWLKRKRARESAEEREPGEPLIAAVLMEGESFPFDEFQAQAARSRVCGRKVTGLEIKDDAILSFSLGDELAALALMPAPYPWSDLEGPCATSWMWPEETSATDVKRHRTHLLVTMTGGRSDPIPRRLMLTAMTALAARQPGVLGVYWPDGTLVHYPPVFVEMADAVNSPEAPPLYLWVDFRLFRNDDGTIGLFTTGLKAIGFMEIEIPKIDMDPIELRDWTVNIAYYLIEKGPVLSDGDTIGMTAEQKIRIRHLPSLFGKEETVLRFEA